MDGNERTDGVRAKRLCKGDFLLRGKARGRKIRRPESLDKLSRKDFYQPPAIILGHVDNLRQRRPAPGLHSEKTAAKRRTLLAVQLCRIPIAKAECARHRPISRRRRHV